MNRMRLTKRVVGELKQARDEVRWKRIHKANRDKQLRLSAVAQRRTKSDEPPRASRSTRNQMSPLEARDLLAMGWYQRDLVLYPYPREVRRMREYALIRGRGRTTLLRQHRDEAVLRFRVIQYVAGAVLKGIIRQVAFRSAARTLGIEANSFRAAVDKVRSLWESRCQLDGEVSPKEDAEFQLRSCIFAQRDADEFIEEHIETMWPEGMEDSRSVLMRKIGSLAQELDVTLDELSKWMGSGVADWDQKTMCLALAAMGAIHKFVTIDGRIPVNYHRLRFAIGCAVAYFRKRLHPPSPLTRDQTYLLELHEWRHLSRPRKPNKMDWWVHGPLDRGDPNPPSLPGFTAIKL